METGIDRIVDRIYQEGVDKARLQADKLLEEAQAKADSLLAGAQKEAQKIRERASQESNEQRLALEAELKFAATQALTRVKERIRNLVAAGGFSEEMRGAARNPELIQKIILLVTEAWLKEGEVPENISLVLPADLYSEFEKFTESSIAVALKGAELKFDENQETGFKIIEKAGALELDFTHEAFSEFFKPFLKNQLSKSFFQEHEES